MKTNNQMKSNPMTDQMNRGEFIRSLGLSSATLMAFYCMGTGLTACSKSSSNDPTPSTSTETGVVTSGTVTTVPTTSSGLTGNTQTSKGAISFTIDLTNADFTALKTVGNTLKVGDVLIADTKANGYVALQRLCTHQQNDRVSYQLADDDFLCDAHGSEFRTDGSVKVAAESGQAAMKVYRTSLSTDSTKLTITA
ncbi:Rieske 2Fe-2S domain-containing protein [Spirosoma sp. HMF4905]|uniref:Rieske 2Fe-2S domain-containing protein n=1 Tax=Spirosoma arboris TaxID=2682092 RepID=A0A7K1S6U1_9BACT|nr:Rieske 2Fe-2S domain-containing protein [Spirosoma arboris]MVM29524.1 Rieske 2Fe-2S domain-containing protein [Spirosoma arboris]